MVAPSADNKRLKTEDVPPVATISTAQDEERESSDEDSAAEMSEDDGNLRF